MFRLPIVGWKIDFQARSMFVTGGTWVFVTRVNKDKDGRWTDNKIKLPWFGSNTKKKVIKLHQDENSITERHQLITMTWLPYFCFYMARNTIDLTTKYYPDTVA